MLYMYALAVSSFSMLLMLLARHLSKEVYIKISKSHLARILHELGLAYKKPKAYVKAKIQIMKAKAGFRRL